MPVSYFAAKVPLLHLALFYCQLNSNSAADHGEASQNHAVPWGTPHLACAITEVAGFIAKDSPKVKPNHTSAKPWRKPAHDSAAICLRVRPELSNSGVDQVELSENFFSFCELRNSR
jgi:hypothetical protein